MVRTAQNLLHCNRPVDFHDTWYEALGTPTHFRLFKWWPWSDLDLSYNKVKFGNLGFSMGKWGKRWIFKKQLQPVAFSKWKLVSIEAQDSFLDLLFPRFCMFCAYTRPRYQVSVYRTIGPLVSICIDKRHFEKIIWHGAYYFRHDILEYIHK